MTASLDGAHESYVKAADILPIEICVSLLHQTSIMLAASKGPGADSIHAIIAGSVMAL